MCGAGGLPARMASEARRRGWRVVAFAFAEAPGVSAVAHRTIPSRLGEIGAVLAALEAECVTAVLFSGKFWAAEALGERRLDAEAARVRERAGSMADRSLVGAAIATLADRGITVLDQRPFIGEWPGPEGCLTRRAPTAEEWVDVRRGLDLARRTAAAGIGQTVVLKRGAVAAVEALEGTTEAVRRGTALAGPGAVVVKAVAPEHDYRFDTPTVGLETVEAAGAGGAAVVAVEAGRVLVLDRELAAARADAAGLALVSVADVAEPRP